MPPTSMSPPPERRAAAPSALRAAAPPSVVNWWATAAPMCTSGASGPTARPLVIAATVPTTLVIRVRMRSRSGTCEPLRKAITWVTPPPLAAGAHSSTISAAARMPAMLTPAYAPNAAASEPPSRWYMDVRRLALASVTRVEAASMLHASTPTTMPDTTVATHLASVSPV